MAVVSRTPMPNLVCEAGHAGQMIQVVTDDGKHFISCDAKVNGVWCRKKPGSQTPSGGTIPGGGVGLAAAPSTGQSSAIILAALIGQAPSLKEAIANADYLIDLAKNWAGRL